MQENLIVCMSLLGEGATSPILRLSAYRLGVDEDETFDYDIQIQYQLDTGAVINEEQMRFWHSVPLPPKHSIHSPITIIDLLNSWVHRHGELNTLWVEDFNHALALNGATNRYGRIAYRPKIALLDTVIDLTNSSEELSAHNPLARARFYAERLENYLSRPMDCKITWTEQDGYYCYKDNLTTEQHINVSCSCLDEPIGIFVDENGEPDEDS